MLTPEQERAQREAQTIAAIRKEYGAAAIMTLGQSTHAQIEAIPTRITELDMAIGIGGLPRGRIVEIFGPESGGKTTLCLQTIATVQRAGGKAAIIDAEHALDKAWAKRVGVDVDNLLVSQPDSGEEALGIAEVLIKGNFIDVIVIDSVAGLVPKSELEGEMGAPSLGAQARLMSQALRKLAGSITSTRTTAIFTNQIREKVGVIFGNPETTPGGKALKFWASVRIRVSAGEILKDAAGKPFGRTSKFKVVKNKVAPPFHEAEALLRFDLGYDLNDNLIRAALAAGVLTK